MFIYFCSHGSSLIGLPFPPSFGDYCFFSCDLAYIDMCSDLVFDDVCSTLLPAMRLVIYGSLLLLIVVANGRFLVICHNLFHRWTSWRTDVILIVCHNCAN